MKTSELFEKELEFISNEDLRNIVIDTLDHAPKCIQTISASSSMKYHPKADIKIGHYNDDGTVETGGLVNHIKTVTAICRCLMDSDNFKDIVFGTTFKPQSAEDYEQLILYQDCAIAACILHDCCKASDEDEKHVTKFEHPLLAAKLFVHCAKQYVNDDNKVVMKKAVALTYGAIASHMGCWNEAKYAPGIILPKPMNGLEVIVHLSDYIASRKFIDFNFEVYENSF